MIIICLIVTPKAVGKNSEFIPGRKEDASTCNEMCLHDISCAKSVPVRVWYLSETCGLLALPQFTIDPFKV